MIFCLHSDVPTHFCFTQMLGICCLLVHIDLCTAKRNIQWLDTYRAVNTQYKIGSKCQLLTHNFLPFRSTWVRHHFFSGVRVARSLVFCVVFCGLSCMFFVLLVIVLSALLWVTDSDYLLVILKLFFQNKQNILTLPINVKNDSFWHRQLVVVSLFFLFLKFVQIHFLLSISLTTYFLTTASCETDSGKRVKITLDLLPESKLFNQTTQPLGKSRQKPNHEVSLLITSSLFLTK